MADTNPEFAIQRLYVKDVSFEAPNTPAVFKEEWKPEINLEINSKAEKLEDNLHEVVLRLTATAKKAEKVLFVVEVKQAGIFLTKDFSEKDLQQVLGALCPNILFPYARELITRLVTDGGFPALYLAPINFDAIYAQQLAQQTAQPASTTTH